jgi:hypothetical protein
MNLSVDVSPLDKSMESVKRGKRNLLATSFDVLNHSVYKKDYKTKYSISSGLSEGRVLGPQHILRWQEILADLDA